VAVPTRPERLVVVTGTGTEVGKTWVAARVLSDLRLAGVSVSARKPAQSYDPADRVTDAHLLGEASGEPQAEVCPTSRWYEVPMAPPMAADLLGRPLVTMADLLDELRWPDPAPALGIVEGAGGLRSPLADDGDTLTLVEELQPEAVVVVADAGLGAINEVRLTMESLDRGHHVASIVVFLNRYDGTDELHRRNRAWLATRDGYDVVATVPELVRRLR
jgi:dethiobiotin synthetase